MTKEEVREKLLEMKEQYIFEITGEKAKKKTYSKLYFFKLNDNRYLACDIISRICNRNYNRRKLYDPRKDIRNGSRVFR